LWEIDLIIWWSPCQWFSFAGKQLAFDDPRSKLFFTMVDIINHYRPKYFLLENVKMKKEYQNVITQYMWVNPIEINSSLLSAQNRKRLYRTNIPWVEQPHDKGILLKDILEDEVDKKYYLSNEVFEKLRKYESNWRIEPKEWKSRAITTMQWWHRQPKILATQVWQSKNFGNAWGNDKWYTIRSNTWHWVIELSEPPKIRKLTPLECERLQTVPDNYSDCVSNSQRYKMLWNWRTVDVISHILSGLKK
jgi:DNA-cytosine methyltransferase